MGDAKHININDSTLMEAIMKFKEKLYLHKDTIDILEWINNKIKNGATFRNKEVTEKIVKSWKYILHDCIYNLKCCDFRENAHWNKKKDRYTSPRDINNEVTFGLDALESYFKKFTEFENVLYGIDTGYRDHVLHVFRVWLLGIVLMKGKDGEVIKFELNNIEFEELIPGKCVLFDEEIISMWGIIALCHDLGYPLEKAEKINESVEQMYRYLGKMNIQRFSAAFRPEHLFSNGLLLDFISSKVIPPENHNITKKLKSNYDAFKGNEEFDKINETHKKLFLHNRYFMTAIQPKFYNKFAKSLEYYSHGIISCSILNKALFYFLESDFNIQEKTKLAFEDARQFYIRREILRSIAAHTCPEIYHIKATTLSFLLILCDELQEWGRPRFEELKTESIGGIKNIAIYEFEKENIEFKVEYSGISDPDTFARKAFRRWHAILRSAVDDTNRKFKLKYTLSINDKEYVFCYENKLLKVEYKPTASSKSFEIYSLDDE